MKNLEVIQQLISWLALQFIVHPEALIANQLLIILLFLLILSRRLHR
jgi:hypothetical protein